MIIFYSYGYHVVAIREGPSGMLRKYANPAASVSAGSVTATFTACSVNSESALHGNDLDMKGATHYTVDGTEITIDLENTLGEWSRVLGHAKRGETIKFYAANVLACKEPKRTVGLGDAISASALTKEL